MLRAITNTKAFIHLKRPTFNSISVQPKYHYIMLASRFTKCFDVEPKMCFLLLCVIFCGIKWIDLQTF